MKTVFFDVDTQLDFLVPSGALYAAGAENIAEGLATLTDFAVSKRIPIVSTLDSHAENDPEFKIWKPHCVIGTQGHQKYSRTAVDSKAGLQIVVPKNSIDIFESPELERVLENIHGDRYVVYGLITEYCIRAAAFGLFERGLRVELVQNAIHSIDDQKAGLILDEFTSRGGHLVTINDVTLS
jgi:nicotinamidase/pyrazinamidase